MKYRLILKANPVDRTAPKRYYANAVTEESISLQLFAGQIAGRSSLTRGDIENVLENFLDELPLFLMMGHSIKLGTFGTLRLTLSSEGALTEDEFTVEMIRGVHVVFTPSPEFKRALLSIKYEKEKNS